MTEMFKEITRLAQISKFVADFARDSGYFLVDVNGNRIRDSDRNRIIGSGEFGLVKIGRSALNNLSYTKHIGNISISDPEEFRLYHIHITVYGNVFKSELVRFGDDVIKEWRRIDGEGDLDGCSLTITQFERTPLQYLRD